MKLEVKTASMKQSAIPELNKKEKTVNYIIIGEGDDKVIINIGEENHKKLTTLISKNDKK